MQQIPQIEEKCLPRNIIEPIDSLQIITSTESAQKVQFPSGVEGRVAS